MQIRVTDIERAAVRPISSHGCHVKSILPLSHAVFASGGDDGTIRCFDSRQSHSSNASSSNDHRSLLGEWSSSLGTSKHPAKLPAKGAMHY